MKRLYVLIDKDLDPVYGCVQGGHAVAQYLIDNQGKDKWSNEYLIYLYADLSIWIDKLNAKNLNYSFFKEPDLNNRITAIALENDGKIFKKLNLVS